MVDAEDSEGKSSGTFSQSPNSPSHTFSLAGDGDTKGFSSFRAE